MLRKNLSERRRKEVASLAQKKYREQLGQSVVEGVRALDAAIRAGAPLVEIFVTEQALSDSHVSDLLDKTVVPVYVLTEIEIARLSDVQTSQGVLAVVRTLSIPEEKILDQRSVLVLDGVQDPGNVGTIIRTAAWFGTDVVVAGTGTADFFNPKVIRASMGAVWDVLLARTRSLPDLLIHLNEAGFSLFGADLKGTDVRKWHPSLPSALILGSEAHGLSADTRRLVHETLSITGRADHPGTESLNVATAAGILIYQWLGN